MPPTPPQHSQLGYLEPKAPEAPSLLALTPLLWVLIPLLFGYSVAESLPTRGTSLWLWLSLAVSLLGMAYAGLRVRGKRRSCALRLDTLSKIAFVLGCGILSYAYASYREPAVPLPELIVAKELTLKLRIERLFSPSKTSISGLGYIASDKPYLQDIKSHRVYFRASKKANPQALDQPELFLKTSLIQTKGVLRSIAEPKNDFERFLKDQNIRLCLDCCRFEKVLEAPSAFRQWCELTAQKLEHNLRQGSNPAYSSTHTAMVLGRKGEMHPETKRLFNLSGTMHIFAISGLHIGIVAGGLVLIAKFIQQNRYSPLWICNSSIGIAAMLLGLSLVYLYVGITGFSPSAERAFAMLCLASLAYIAKRQTHVLGLLVAAATGMLLWDPGYLQNLGFQLSFAAVAGIALYGLPMAECLINKLGIAREELSQSSKQLNSLLQRTIQGSLRYLIQALCLSLGASLACAPLCIQHFKVLAYGGVLINTLLLPLASVGVLLGAASSGLLLLHLGCLSPYLNASATALISLMEGWIHLCLKLPGMYTSITTVRAPAGTMGLALILASMFCIHLKAGLSKEPIAYALPLLIFLSLYVFFVCS